jgi:hypothetical protein
MRLIEAFVALIVGRRVPIAWDGRASLDSQGTIHLPRPTTGDAAEIGLLTRLAVHEAGHVLHTEQGFADRLDQVELIIFNVLEDPRMEREQCGQYPGAGLVLTRGLDEMLQGLEKSWEAECPQPGKAFALDLLLRGFLKLAPHDEIVRRAPRMLELLAPAISEKEREAIELAAVEITTAENSIDAENIARALVARLRQQERPPPPQEADSKPGPQPEQEQEQEQEPAGAEQQDPEAQAPEPEQGGDASNRADSPQPATGDSQDDDSLQQDENDVRPGPANGADSNESGAHDGDEGQTSTPDDGATADPASTQTAPADAAASSGGAPQDAGDDVSTDQPSDGGANTPQGESQQQAGQGGGDPSPAGTAAGTEDSQAPAAGEVEGAASNEPGQAGASGMPSGLVEMAQLEPFDMGSLLRQTLAERYGAPDVDAQAEASDPGPISDDELERVRAAVIAADADGDLEQLLEVSLQALAAVEPGDEQATQGVVVGGASMALAGGEGQGGAQLLDLRLQGVQARLVSVLQREFQDRKRRPTKAANAGGRIIAQRHWRLARLGDTRVFAKKRIANGIEAAATLLVDSSYSMKERLQPALEVTLAFSLALQRLGVRTKVVRFPASDTVLLETLQQFGESPRRCTERCRGISADGGTPIGAATAVETELLLQQNRLKNFLAIVTDDEPGDPDTYLAALAQARELDVQVVGVGIGCDISQWIPESVSITNVDQLPDALSALFRSNVVMKLAA